MNTKKNEPARTKRSCENKKAMIRAAQKLFAERGFDNVSIDDIAGACGLTKGAFYYSFKSKNDIMYEIERFRFNLLAHDLKQSDAKGLERLREYIVQWSTYLASDGVNITRQWLTQNINPPLRKAANPCRAAFTDDTAFIASFLQEAKDQGDLGSTLNPEESAQLIAFTLYGYATHLCMFEEENDAARWGKTFAETLCNALVRNYPTNE